VSPEALLERIRTRFDDALLARDEVTVTVLREQLLDTLAWLRDEPDVALGTVADVSCTDWPGRDPRIWMAYHLFSMEHGHRLRVKVGLAAEDLSVPSIALAFPAAEWYEREVYDFFGVIFDGHPDLQRIIMPDGWEGHPLRKDHPLGGVRTMYHGATVPPPDERGL
jgi:NADH-quinone oxidoreductase subunit C